MKNLINSVSLPLLIAAYITLCGGLRLYSFWDTFGVDISSYVSLTDLPISAIPNLYRFLISLAIAALFFSLIHFFLLKSRLTEGDKNRFPRVLFWSTLISIVGVIWAIGHYKEKSDLVNGISVIIVCYVSFLLSIVNLPLPPLRFPFNLYRSTFIFLVVALPINSITQGIQDGELVMDGKCQYVKRMRLKEETSSQPVGLKYVGKLGNRIFMIPDDNSEIISVSIDDLAFLNLVYSKESLLKSQ